MLDGHGLPGGFIWEADEGYLQRGRAVHIATQYMDEGDLRRDYRTKPIEGYLDAYDKFKRQTKIQILKIELAMFSRLYRFAGTLDRLVLWNGYEWVLDIKSGPSPAWGGYQTGGYDLLLPAAAKMRKRACLELRADGSYNLTPHQDPHDRATFLSLLTTYYARRKNGKRAPVPIADINC